MSTIYTPNQISLKEYVRLRALLLKSFKAEYLFRDGYADAFLPFPCLQTREEIQDFCKIQKVLESAIKQIVLNYSSDLEIQKVYSLSVDTKRELCELKDASYSIGLIRPDFLVSDKGRPLVCEINARFVFNAFYMTHEVDRVLAKVYKDFISPSNIRDFPKNLSSSFNIKEVAIIKGREAGYDVHTFMLENVGVKLFDVQDLKTVIKKYKTIILELHQDELEPYLGLVCGALKKGVRFINDPRTIYLVHDKRILALLTDEKIMAKYMSGSDCRLLQKYITPTLSKGNGEKVFKEAISNKDKWVIKKAISGKSDGLYTGKFKTDNEWAKIIREKDIIIQPYVKQKKFKYWNPYTQKMTNAFLVGTLPQMNSKAYGVGLYRLFDIEKEKFSFFVQPVLKLKNHHGKRK